MKGWHLQAAEWDASRSERFLLSPPPVDRIRTLLDLFERDDLSAWWKLNQEMRLEPDSEFYDYLLEADLTALPGWRDADDATRLRLMAAALRYVETYDPRPNDWIGTSTLNLPAVAGYRALRLLLKLHREAVESLPNGAWELWAPTLLASQSLMENDGGEEPSALLALAYENAPETILTTAMRLLDHENERHQRLFLLRKLRNIWDKRLAAALLEKLCDKRLEPEALGDLLGELLQHEEREAGTYALGLIDKKVPSRGRGRARFVVAARELLAYSADSSWTCVWPLIQRPARIGREILISLAGSREGNASIVAGQLDEHRVAQFFVRMVRMFPFDDDPTLEGARWVGPIDEARDLRDGLLRVLRDKGTWESVGAIQWISRQMPELDWLSRTAQVATHNVLLKTWLPPRSSDFLELARDQQVRYVSGGTQLLDVLQESLERLQTKLRGELSPVRALWDRVSQGRYRPIDEEDLSDYIGTHFKDDLISRGIVINREVQIRRGEQTDVHVDAIAPTPNPAPYRVVSSIIEVKGCWHAELKTAMKGQLADRYMKGNSTSHGLYVVGWFSSPRWDPKDWRVQRCAGSTPVSLRAELDQQAENLSAAGQELRAFVLDASYSTGTSGSTNRTRKKANPRQVK